MKQLIQSVKGTRDFYPEEMSIRTWLYQKINEVSSSFGYEEYEGPILERLELYAAKSGEELVKEQSFVFSDRGGDQITLRPELTPTLARMIAQRQSELVFPVRWWSFGPFWRYEKPQKGRTREFFQWNCDILGVNSPEADAELVAVAASFLRSVGLTPSEVKIYVNNRRLMDALIGELGVEPENRKNIFHIIDRRDKLSAAAGKIMRGKRSVRKTI
jgi:histidyl-tRNA synthetase